MSCIVVLMLFMASTAYFLVIWRRRKATLHEISLTKRTTVFIAYADDCEQHSAAVVSLAELLKQYANADVFLDQFELKYAGEFIFFFLLVFWRILTMHRVNLS